MKKNKLGFTLTEVLLVLVVTGVILAISVNALKSIKMSYTPLSYYANKNVELITRTLFLGDYSSDNTVTCRTNTGSIVTILKPDGVGNVNGTPLCSSLYSASSSGGAGNKICNTMLGFVNIAGAKNCDDLYSVAFDAAHNNEPYISDISDSKRPTFTATNGQRYYLSSSTFSSNVSSDIGFRVLAVDLNGSRKPNTHSPEHKSPPDIVSFLIMDNGDVYPLGVLADNLSVELNAEQVMNVRYLASSIKGYCRRGISRDDCAGVISDTAYVPVECKDSSNPDISKCGFIDKSTSLISYRQAKCATSGLANTNTKISYPNYCQPVIDACILDNSHEYCNYLFRCPPSPYSARYDACKTENVKPIFRFNFN
ncbi:prepilin-type N-terminal cleavage/methylation domain-containing protein [bacterium]|nr:prepilin-type N-terminal cleavage/methylation domain-containing protein [bacterium]